MRRMLCLLLAAVALAHVAGCTSNPSQRRLHVSEDAYDTGGPIRRQFHSALYYPSEISLRFDGYIVGVEKAPRRLVDPMNGLQIRNIPEAGLSNARSRIDDATMMFVSHVIKTHADKAGDQNCSLFNAYAISDVERKKQVISECAGYEGKLWRTDQAALNSWSALDSLRDSLRVQLAGEEYSHVLVIVMGWNTAQEEAVRNFNSLALQMMRAAPKGKRFKPLVIGVTWPSQWSSKWFDPLLKLGSFGVKARDADELGLTWLGVLLHQTIPAANNASAGRPAKPVVVVGHSFGSRASSLAACVGPVIHSGQPALQRAHIDAVINFQGAFLTRLLLGEEEQSIRFPDACANVREFALTASAHDTAVAIPFWGLYAGDIDSYRAICDKPNAGINCACAHEDGSLSYRQPRDDRLFVTYVDASRMISDNAYETGGGAHSDIYRREHGTFVQNFLQPGEPKLTARGRSSGSDSGCE